MDLQSCMKQNRKLRNRVYTRGERKAIQMKAVKVKEGIYWVGAIDWNIRNFHGYQTGRGTTYGAYLILDEKITLIDTVKPGFEEEMCSRIAEVIPPAEIDIIISNHVEMDHSGGLPFLWKLCPNAVIYTSGASGIKGLSAHYGDGPYLPAASKDTINIGRRTLTFVATPMLHWPDNMVVYCPEEQILFSNDAFGQHLATTERFDDETNLAVALEEAKKYYANILLCYGKQAQRAWEIVCNLKIEMIAPSHGIIWRSHIRRILDAYGVWSNNESAAGAMVVYDSMWRSTEKMAAVIADAFGSCGLPARLYDLKQNHPSNIVPDLLDCKYIAVGSPTLNNQMMPNVAGFLCYIKGLSPGNREAFAFGSYGWGGQSVGLIEKELRDCGFHIALEGIKCHYIPQQEQLGKLRETVCSMVRKEG